MSYCSAEEVKSFAKFISYKDMGFESESEYSTHLATVLIPMASQFIDGECRRPTGYFADGGVSVIDYFDGLGTDIPSDLLQYEEKTELWTNKARRFILNERPVRSITEVAEYVNDNWVVRVATDYRIVGAELYFKKNIPASGWKNVRITYVAGYTAIPKDVKFAAALLCANFLQKSAADRMAGAIRFDRPSILDFSLPQIYSKDVQSILNRYRKLDFGVI